jgi:hypothetical protein
MLEALCRQSSTTLDIVHAEEGPPITQRTSGLVASSDQHIYSHDIRTTFARILVGLPFALALDATSR